MFQTTLLLYDSNDREHNVVSSNPAHGKVHSIQDYVIKFVNDLRHVDDFFRVLRFPPHIKRTTKI